MKQLAYILLILLLPSSAFITNAGNNEPHSFNSTNHSVTLPLIGIRINNGAKYTNNKSIEVEVKSLKTDKSMLESMKVGFSPDLSDGEWQPYSEEPLQLQLNGDDGEKRIYVQLKDKAGNNSPIESNKIVFDSASPTNAKIILNKGEKYTNDKLGRILVNAKANEAHEIMISNFSNFQNGRWEKFKESIKWIIDIGAGDGEKTVHAKFRDYAGNESEPVTASIFLDLTPPLGGIIQINDGEKYTRSKKFNLKLKSQDATMVRVVSRGVGKNFDYKPDANGYMNIQWITDSMQGVKHVKAYFMDEAKNTTKIPAEASIIYKTTAPKRASISIDQGHKYTNNKDGVVSLRLSIKENPQTLKMLISNFPNFEGAKERSFVPTISNWQLDHENDGLKTIYVRLIDQAGNISEASKAEVFLDRTAPVINAFDINGKSEWSISLRVTLNCDVDDAYEAQYSNNINTLKNIKWEKYNEQRPEWAILPNDGEKIVFARFKDEAGNISEVTSSKIMLDMTPPKGRLIINGGNKVTNHSDGIIKLQINHDEDVIGMQITNIPEFNEVKLLPLEKTIENWTVDGNEEDGPKTVFLRLKDKAGNFSKIYSSGIILDRTSPTNCDLVINNNDPFVRNKQKKVSLSLRAEGANFVMISNKQSMEGGQWIPFKSSVGWTLEGPEGIHYVHVKFKDQAGNESPVITKMITSDFAPPKIKNFAINDAADFCTDPQGSVRLNFDVEDAVTMAISNNHLNDTSTIKGLWEPYQATKEWKLEGEDGLKLVYGRFSDDAGNITHEYYDKIILDRIPPTDGRISINNGAEWFTNKEGKGDVNLYAKDAHEVMISNSQDFSKSKWETMIEVRKGWTFSIAREKFEIFAKFRDKAGNVSEPVSASIKVDTDPPRNASIIIDDGAKYVTNKERRINLSIKVEGATGMRVSQNNTFRDVRWEPIATSKEFHLAIPDGEVEYFAQFSDDAGNLSPVVSSKIILDTTPPKINKLSINDGAEWTNHAEKKVSITIDAEGANEMMVSNNPMFADSSWEPYKKSISNFELPGEDGEKVVFIKLKDEPGNISKVATAKINLKRSF